jgi:diguanylate cyclase (GGDEF)-like protein
MLMPNLNQTNHNDMSENQHVFLMAEDNPADEEIVREMLSQAFGDKYAIVCVDKFSKIAEALTTNKFEVLILDMGLPDQSGINNVKEIGIKYPDLPIVVLTGQDDLEQAAGALQLGAQDYLSKNHITPEILSRSLYYAQERKQIEQRLKAALEDSAFRNTQLEAQAKHDSLTGLPNRNYIHEAGERILFRARRNQQKLAMVFFDLNGFKKVNDSYGHIVGDQLLKLIANKTKLITRGADLLARLSGDEFVILTDILHEQNEVYPLLSRIQDVFSNPFLIEQHQIIIRPSIGVSFFPDADNLELLIKNADCAMYEAKHSNDANNICFFNDKMAQQFERANKIEQHLCQAIKKEELTVYFQPVVCANSTSVNVEALIRWFSPELGFVPPDEFINIAEATPIINDITRIVIQHSALLLKESLALKTPIESIAINISATQFNHPHFHSLLIQWLHEFDLPTDKVIIELTERQLVNKAEACNKQFQQLRKLGVKIALDDFGTGYSSLTQLLALEMDELKLDRLLIRDIDTNKRHRALVTGIIAMARELNLNIIAEGVETEAEFNAVKAMKVDLIQGYLIAKPMPHEDLLNFLKEDHKFTQKVS